MRKARVVTGTALRIYVVLLSAGKPLGVRELQHIVGLKSPSTVKYHLDRLRSEGLVKQLMDGRYVAVRSNSPVTSLYLFFKSVAIPRLVPASVAYAAFIATYAAVAGIKDLAILAPSVAFAAYVIYEALKLRSFIKALMRAA